MRKWIFLFLFTFIVTEMVGLEQALSQARGQRGRVDRSSQPAEPLKSADGSMSFAEAKPEDITSENFPNLIESFDYPNADISEIVKAISKLTGKNFILERGVQGKISIIAPSQITVAEAYQAFLTALAMNGFTVVPSGNFLKVRPLKAAAQDSIETYAGAYFPITDQLITRIIRLNHINAEEVQRTLQGLVDPGRGDIKPYAPTNSLIITDFGSNIERIQHILKQLDVPGFEEQLRVIPIKHARARDIADLIDQIINKGQGQQQFTPGIPRFRAGRQQQQQPTGGGGGSANFSLVIPDQRTNSIIVVGNEAGIERVRDLVNKLDFKLRPEDSGGVYVYYVRHGEAEKIADVLGGLATESQQRSSPPQRGGQGGDGPTTSSPIPSQPVFGGDIRIVADKENNALIITSSRPDYEVVRSILSKLDIPRDQVFVKAIIMEMNAEDSTNWGIDYYRIIDGTGGIGRSGFRSGKTNLFQPQNDSGLVLGWADKNELVNVTIGGQSLQVPSLSALINFLKTNNNANILSTPTITALDNEEAEIVVGENVPVSQVSNQTSVGTTAGVERQDLDLKLNITPFISPDTDTVRMKIDQQIRSLSNTRVRADALAQQAVAFSTRSIKTNVIVNSNDTAVLGGLMQDEESEEVTKIPLLGDIPILGWLFKGKSTEVRKRNLMVFITPRILRSPKDSQDLVNDKLDRRIDFVQQNMRGRDPHGAFLDRLPRGDQHASKDDFGQSRKSDFDPIVPGGNNNQEDTLDDFFEDFTP